MAGWTVASFSLQGDSELALHHDAAPVAGDGVVPELGVLLRQRPVVSGAHPQAQQVPPLVDVLVVLHTTLAWDLVFTGLTHA